MNIKEIMEFQKAVKELQLALASKIIEIDLQKEPYIIDDKVKYIENNKIKTFDKSLQKYIQKKVSIELKKLLKGEYSIYVKNEEIPI